MENIPATYAIVALGANLPFGDIPPEATLRAALAALEAKNLTIAGLSSFWGTPCFPAGAGPDYVNAVAIIQSDVAFLHISWLQMMHEIEARFGRERHSRWGGRTLDLDLVAIGESVCPDAATQDQWRCLPPEAQMRLTPEELILPHPRLQDRAFVLVPMAEVAPDWRHPRLGLTVTEMLAALPAADRDAVRRM